MALTDDQRAKLFEVLGLENSFKDLEFGGLIKQLDLTFRLPVTVENEEFLTHIFGTDWLNYVEYSWENDDGVDKDNWVSEIGNTYTDEFTTYYKYYRFHKDAFINITGERLVEITQQFVSFIVDTKQPCPNDQFIIVVVLIALTIASAGSLAPETGAAWTAYVAYYAAIVSGILSIGLATNSFGKKEREIAQYALYATALAGGIATITSSNASWAAYMTAGMQIANTAIAGINTYEQNQHTDQMKKMEKELEQLEEESAEEFEKAFKFFYGDSYDSIYRDGHEAYQHRYVYDTYKDFSVY